MTRSHRHPAGATRPAGVRRAGSHKRRRPATRRLLNALAVTAVLAGSGAVIGIANAADGPLVARFDYALQERVKTDHRGAVTNMTPSWEHIHPNEWWVDLDACVSTPRETIVNHHWEIELPDDLLVVDYVPDRCAAEVKVTAPQGSYPVTLTVTDNEGQEASTTGTLTIKDHVIVSLGDSVASGEGNPDVPKTEGNLRWYDRRCHRSGLTSTAQAARRVEEADKYSTVTFVSLACSGATVINGLTGEYEGAEPRDNDGNYVTDPVEAQVLKANKLLCAQGYAECFQEDGQRRIDVLLLTIGANDLHFSTIVTECAHPLSHPCYNDSDTIPRLRDDLRELPTRLDYAGDTLDSYLDYSRLVFPMYFDPTLNEAGNVCENLDFEREGFNGSINHAEATWAREQVVAALNTHIMAAAQRANRAGHNWSVLRMADRFARNGYCTDDAHRAIVRYDESFLTNGSDMGTMHPNWRGHQFYEEEIVAALQMP